jgi:hypothetical protein
MGRKKLSINVKIEDPLISKIKNPQVSNPLTIDKVAKNLMKIYKQANQIYMEQGRKELSKLKIYTLKESYDYLREHGVPLSFRAFAGRVERGTLPVLLIGKRRYVNQEVLDNIVNLHKNYYKVIDAYKVYRQAKPITLRAFLGRVEKNIIPSIKAWDTRYIPKELLETHIHLATNYYTISELLQELKKHGIRINKQALERRVDRGTIPAVKIKGKRYVHKDVAQELIKLELARLNNKKN